MPLYEYECSACGHRFELIQKFSDPPEKACPKCGGELHKLVGAPAMKFKGSGWYVTDYGKSTKDTKGKKDSTEATEKTESTEKKTDSVATEAKTSTESSTSTKKDSKS